MLSRTASNLYWTGRLVERADFTTALIEATIRLSSLSAGPASLNAWASALAVLNADRSFGTTREKLTPRNVARYLTLGEHNISSIRSCLDAARNNARAARNRITSEVWGSINRAWLNIRDRQSPGSMQATLSLLEELKAEARGFEGALMRMLRSEGFWFIRLGQVIERGDNTARLLDVKYHILLPEGERIGGQLDRDQWTTILQTVSAKLAYRSIYRQGLKPWLIADLLVLRESLPRSLAASAAETVDLLNALGERTGRQGEADRLARQRRDMLETAEMSPLFQKGLHEFLRRYIRDNMAIHQAVIQQFRFA